MKSKHVLILVACLAAIAVLAWPAIALLTGPTSATNGQIAFSLSRDGTANIYVMDASPGASPVLLTTDPANDFNPSWSPDGTKIGFVSDRDGTWEIYSMNADGSGESRLTNDLTHHCTYSDTLAWSPDGSKIAFARGLHIWLMNADGIGEIPAENSLTSTSLNPTWSPNGTRIAFDAGTAERGIYAMNADGSEPIRLTNNFESDQDPAWSPDGTRIVFESYRDGNWEIYMMNADGSEQTRLTIDAARDIEPCWSPDGTKVAFIRRSTDGSGKDALYMMDADGSHPVCLLDTTSGVFIFRPSWGR